MDARPPHPWTWILTACLAVASLLAFAPTALAGSADRNRDRIPDSWEKAHGLSVKSNQARKDHDRDRLDSLAEYRSGTNPRKADSDGDGRDDTLEDRDRDGVDNGNEVRQRTLPNRRDSDRDGIPDGREDTDRDDLDNGAEDRSGNDPKNPDTDDDGIEDGEENAGVVVSFKDKLLTIRLPNGEVVKGIVNDDTEIYCDDEDGYESEDDWYPDEDAAQSLKSPGDDDFVGEGDDTDCSTADLEAGTIVHEAEAELLPGGLVFRDVDLLVEFEDD